LPGSILKRRCAQPAFQIGALRGFDLATIAHDGTGGAAHEWTLTSPAVLSSEGVYLQRALARQRQTRDEFVEAVRLVTREKHA
jgi:hypothetical protein